MTYQKCLILTFILLSLASNAIAEQGWTFELRPGVSFPVDDLGEIDLDVSAGFNMTIAYGITPTLAAYGGKRWHQFDTNGLQGLEVRQSGYAVGLQYTNAFTSGSPGYRIHSGLTYEQIELKNSNGEIVFDSDHGAGFELGAALLFKMSENWNLVPGLEYRSLSQDIDFGNTDDDAALSYVKLDVGFLLHF